MNIDGSIGISIKDNSAMDTDMCPFGEVLFRPLLATGRANLTGILWVDLVHLTTGACCLVYHDVYKLSQAIIENALG
jgi:hypothetical protein